MTRPFGTTRGWQDSKKDGAVYLGEWLRISVHNIRGLRKDEWFLSCRALDLECIKLHATEVETAKLEAVKIAARMCTNYRRDLAKSRFALADDGFGPPTIATEHSGEARPEGERR